MKVKSDQPEYHRKRKSVQHEDSTWITPSWRNEVGLLEAIAGNKSKLICIFPKLQGMLNSRVA